MKKIYFSWQHPKNVSASCEASMRMWVHTAKYKVLFENEDVIVLDDSSGVGDESEWNPRVGIIAYAKKENMAFSMHITGSGIGWGKLWGDEVGYLVMLPEELAQPGRSVYDNIQANEHWEEIDHPLFAGLQGDLQYQRMPMVPDQF